jgi:TolB protein
MNADGSNQTRLTNNTVHELGPSWSTDGTKVAYTRTLGRNNEIYVMNADGSNQTNVTNNSSPELDPAWVKVPAP